MGIENKIDTVENGVIIGGAALLAYMLIKSGVLGGAFSALNKALNGDYGAAVSNTVMGKGVLTGSPTPGAIQTGGDNITFGEVVVTSNPFNLIPNLINTAIGGSPSGLTKLNVGRTDAAFAKIGLNTRQVETMQQTIGYAQYQQIQNDIISGSLTPVEIDQLNSFGWTGADKTDIQNTVDSVDLNTLTDRGQTVTTIRGGAR
jgi:hypothetical protein